MNHIHKLSKHPIPKPIPRVNESYKKQRQIGQGVYGTVFSATPIPNPSLSTVALKTIGLRSHDTGFPLTAVREISLLKELSHRNIVDLVDICGKYEGSHVKSIYMVFSYHSYDLYGLLNTRSIALGKSHLKSWFFQLLTGVHYLAANRVLHRDLKSPNILIDSSGELKIADLGLARRVSSGMTISGANNTRRLTANVVTLWYRCPELLLGQDGYDFGMDVWSVGCIGIEMFLGGRQVLRGNDEEQQIHEIFSLCGGGDVSDATGGAAEGGGGVRRLNDVIGQKWSKLRQFVDANPSYLNRKNNIHAVLSGSPRIHSAITPSLITLLEGLLQLDPTKRLTAATALDADYFFEVGDEESALKKNANELDMSFGVGLGDVHECDARGKRK
jgi:serine/threonine protein kinase